MKVVFLSVVLVQVFATLLQVSLAGTEQATCNGPVDCAGTCGGHYRMDCAGVCNGDAFVNDCGYCAGGNTGLSHDKGKDRCGVCTTNKDYQIPWDCHGDCYGNAKVDACGQCVGGNTGLEEKLNAERIDCKGQCDGGATYDVCGNCEPFIPPEGSLYLDCTGQCVTPGLPLAYVNKCNKCVEGSTGRNKTFGIGECGTCIDDDGDDVTECYGCDGVPNSGKVTDLCGICEGDGMTCFGVGKVHPSVIPANKQQTIIILGAGFTDNDELQCLFVREDNSFIKEPVTKGFNHTAIECNALLPTGDYEVAVERNGQTPSRLTAHLIAYSDTFHVAGVQPLDIQINSRNKTWQLDVDVIGGSLRDVFRQDGVQQPYLIVKSNHVNVSDWLIGGTVESPTTMSFLLPMPTKSTRFTVHPSLNGVNALPTYHSDDGFTITCYAKAPRIKDMVFSTSGASVIVNFDHDVNTTRLSGSCSDLFVDVTMLGSHPECRWLDRSTVHIKLANDAQFLQRESQSNVHSLTLKKGAIYTYGEEFSYSASGTREVSTPDDAVKPVAIIEGVPRLTYCDKLVLAAYHSYGGATLQFSWSVRNEYSLTANVTDLLSQLSPDSEIVELEGSLLQINHTYVFILSVTNIFGHTDLDEHNVTITDIAVPSVRIVPRGINVHRALVSRGFYLIAEVEYRDGCVANDNPTVYHWSCDFISVIVDIQTQNQRVLFIPGYSLPGGEVVKFSVRVHQYLNGNNDNEAHLTLHTVYSDLRAVIRGGRYQTFGDNCGQIQLDGSMSRDPDNIALPMTYEWTCIQVTNNTNCYSSIKGSEGLVFEEWFQDGLSRYDSVLRFNVSHLQKQRSYKLTLTIRKGMRQAKQSTEINILEGTVPTVSIEPQKTNTVIKSGDVIQLQAYVSHTRQVESIVWTSLPETGYSYVDLTDQSLLEEPAVINKDFNGFTYETHVTIKADVLLKGGRYLFQCKAVSEDGSIGLARTQLWIHDGVRSCRLLLADYTELEKVEYTIKDCVADRYAYPLTYQIFRKSSIDDQLEIVSAVSPYPSFMGIGPPIISSGSQDESESVVNVFVCRVCDRFRDCGEISVTVEVSRKTPFTMEDERRFIVKYVDDEMDKGNYLDSLVNYNMLLKKSKTQDKDELSSQAIKQLEIAQKIGENNNALSPDDLELLIDQLTQIKVEAMDIVARSEFVDILWSISERFLSFSEDEVTHVSQSSISAIVEKAGAVARSLQSRQYSDITDRTRDTIMDMVVMRTRKLMFGQMFEIKTQDMTITVKKDVLNGVFHSRSTPGPAIVQFGSELEQRFSAVWNCTQSVGSMCSGVSIRIIHYESDAEFPIDDDIAQLTDIIDVSLSNPNSGDVLEITNLTEPVTVSLPILEPSLGIQEGLCHYWDDHYQDWLTNGIDTVISTDSATISCLSSHLSAFVVMSVPQITTPSQSNVTQGLPTQAIKHSQVVDRKDNTLILVSSVLALLYSVVIFSYGGIAVVKYMSANNVMLSADEDPLYSQYSYLRLE